MKDKHISDEEILLYIEDDISIENRIEFEQHLKKCSQCRAKLKEYEILEDTLKKPALYEPPADLLNNIMNTVLNKKLSFEEIFIGLFIGFSGLAAVLSFILYRYGFQFFYNLPLMKINITSLIKTGINNLNELLYVLKKLYLIVDI